MVRIIFACAISALATAVPAAAQQPQSERQASIVVNGAGSVSVAPDYAEITAGVTTKAKTAKEATDANARLMTAVIAALADHTIFGAAGLHNGVSRCGAKANGL
jgi:uncharacterized protein